MRLITTNEQLLALLPNIMTVVKGERPVIDKIVPFIDASEKWLIDNIVSDTVFNSISDRPDPSTAKVTMARIVAFDAFRNAVPHLDLILTPNGFGIVSNSNIAPASKERVERLIASLLSNRDDEIEHLIALLVQEDGWTQSDQGRFFASTMFPNIDVTSRLTRQPGGRWEQYLTVREQLIPMEEFFAVQYISKELLQVFRDESQSGSYRTSQHKYLCNLLRAVEVRCLKTTDPTSAMYFEHTTLVDIVNTIRNNPEDFAEWHASETAKLYAPKIFENKICDKGFWF